MGGLPIQCGKHGPQPATWLCVHARQTLKDGRLRGFYWSDDGKSGWCERCNDLITTRGGGLSERNQRAMEMSVVCGGCFEDAKRINGFD